MDIILIYQKHIQKSSGPEFYANSSVPSFKSFMLQTLYFRVLDECLENLWLSVKKTWSQNTPPVDPNVLALIRSILPIFFYFVR